MTPEDALKLADLISDREKLRRIFDSISEGGKATLQPIMDGIERQIQEIRQRLEREQEW